MRSLRIFLLSTIILVECLSPVVAQDSEPLSKEYKQATIERLSQLMNDFYVFPDVAKETETHLMDLWASGHFDDIEDNGAFAAALTEAVQSVNNDKHMRVRENPPYEAPDNSPERMIEEQIHEVERWRAGNAGFQTVKLLEGNIGYIDIRGFPGMESGKAMADA
jgi:hypothetical protein